MSKINQLIKNMHSDTVTYTLLESEMTPFSAFCKDNKLSCKAIPEGLSYKIIFEGLSDEQSKMVAEYMDSKPVVTEGHGVASVSQLEKRLNKALDEYCRNVWGASAKDFDCKIEVEEKDEETTYIWFLCELSYSDASELSDVLTRIVNEMGHPDSYFDCEDSGRWYCVIWK